ncbi:MAG: SIS domain-containing protein [Gammaproteobacteria bacterium]
MPAHPSTSTQMFKEAGEAADAVARQLDRNAATARDLGDMLRSMRPRAVVTCARGSSAHAATFAKYLIETRAGTLTSAAALSVSSVYGVATDLHETLFLAISQSGKSPDLLRTAERARAAGARLVAIVNVEDSPLAALADHVLPLHAGPETSVAATKSWIASIAAITHLVAHWTRDVTLLANLERLPRALAQAWKLEWTAAIDALQDASSLYVLGRGYGLAAACESALKFKETCGLHAEAISAAEFLHGPVATVRENFPVLVYAQDDATRAGIASLLDTLVDRGVRVLVAGAPHKGAVALPTVSLDAVLQPVLAIQSFYRMVNALALARGMNPDRPRHLRKVTETL